MSDDEIDRLEGEIAERKARLDALRTPATHTELRTLARTDPDRFNELVDAGSVPGRLLAGGDGED